MQKLNEPRKSVAVAIGKGVAVWRAATGMTQAAAVESAGFKQAGAVQYWAAIETGQRLPPFSRLVRMVGAESAGDIVDAAAAETGHHKSAIALLMST